MCWGLGTLTGPWLATFPEAGMGDWAPRTLPALPSGVIVSPQVGLAATFLYSI